MGATAISKKVGVKPSTVSTILRTWRLNQCDVSTLRDKPLPKRNKFTPEQREWIVNPDQLKSMAHLPLRSRAELIKIQYGFDKLSP